MLMEIEDRNQIIDILRRFKVPEYFVVAITNEIRDICNGFGIDEEKIESQLDYQGFKEASESIIRCLKVMNDG